MFHLSDGLECVTPRLIVRPIRLSDRERWIAAHDASGDHFTHWMPYTDPSISHDERFTAQFSRAQAGLERGDFYSFVVEHRHDQTLVGFHSLSQVFRGPFQNAYAGWRISRPYTNQGLGSESVLALLDLAFHPFPRGLGLHRVQANVIPTNAPSLALARRVGFREEGYAKRYLEIDGRYQDHVMFAKLSEEHV
jgi:[ribosomal protein S5]-alanine N-acetyltransferase